MGRNSNKAYYAVARGKNVGVYNSWQDCSANTQGVSNSRYKKFSSEADAVSFINANSASGSSGLGTSGSGSSGTSSVLGFPELIESRGDGNSKSSGGFSRFDFSNVSKGGYTGLSFPIASTGSSKLKASRSAIYVDGAARGNGKDGTPKSGYGVYYGPGDSRNAAVPLSSVDNVSTVKPTNQRAELHALNHALDSALESAKQGSDRYEIYTDSSYAKNCVDTWSKNWAKNGWKSSSGGDVANQDLIKEAVGKYEAVNKLYEASGESKLGITHVRGHQGNVGNEHADRLANEGADKM